MLSKHNPLQMEFITNYVQNTKVILTGDKLIGDIDFIYANPIQLFPTDKELKSILVINTSITTSDTDANTVEAETELVINVYNYEHNLGIEEIYGLFSYATIFNHMTITNEIRNKGIMHNE